MSSILPNDVRNPSTITTATQYPCIYYKVLLNAAGCPIPGTMEPSANAKVTNPCDMALLPNFQITVPAGHSRCNFPNNQRFFYKYSNITGQILPNSLYSQYGAPSSWCVGTESLLEFVKWK